MRIAEALTQNYTNLILRLTRGIRGASTVSSSQPMQGNLPGDRHQRLMVADRKAKQIMTQPITLPPGALDGLELSRREAEVLYQVAWGKTNTEIGCILGVSPRTVQRHLEHIYHKLGVRTRTAAVLRVLAMTWYWSRQQPRDGPYRKPSMACLEEVSFDGQELGPA